MTIHVMQTLLQRSIVVQGKKAILSSIEELVAFLDR